jgi:hypothetical protein
VLPGHDHFARTEETLIPLTFVTIGKDSRLFAWEKGSLKDLNGSNVACIIQSSNYTSKLALFLLFLPICLGIPPISYLAIYGDQPFSFCPAHFAFPCIHLPPCLSIHISRTIIIVYHTLTLQSLSITNSTQNHTTLNHNCANSQLRCI